MAEDSETFGDKEAIAGKLGAAGWGAFFIWIGIAFLTKVSLGVGLIGVGVIALAGEAARKYFGLALDWFWLMVGVIFVVWGLCEAFTIRLGGVLWPILSIGLGTAILFTCLRPHPRHN